MRGAGTSTWHFALLRENDKLAGVYVEGDEVTDSDYLAKLHNSLPGSLARSCLGGVSVARN